MRDERDEEGFPPPCEENAWNLFRDDEYGTVYACLFVEELGEWCWVTIGHLRGP